MKNTIVRQKPKKGFMPAQRSDVMTNLLAKNSHIENRFQNQRPKYETSRSEIFFITSYPPRVCGIATYSQDLIMALKDKFGGSFDIHVCALETGNNAYEYPDEVKYVLNTSNPYEYSKLAAYINHNSLIKIVMIQHEFGFFHAQPQAFQQFLYEVVKPVIVDFHTVLPRPDAQRLTEVRTIAAAASCNIVMTHRSAQILLHEYEIPEQKVQVIPHGTHLVSHLNPTFLKEKYGLKGRKVLSTFGLLSSGKNIETTLGALSDIVKVHPEVIFLIIGKTHPEVVKSEGEKYRTMLETMVSENNLTSHVKFINTYLALPELLDYLQLTDIYLFTTNDPNQAVSGTFAYAMSCACPIISTPIPHAKEVLIDDSGIIIDFRNSEQLAFNVLRLLNDEALRLKISSNALEKIVSTSWENSAISHALVFEKSSSGTIKPQHSLPPVNLSHIRQMTTQFGMIQFSKLNQPDIESGYTLDDNARAMIAMCMHYELTGDDNDLVYIRIYLRFIKFCQQSVGDFLNYVDKHKIFTRQNDTNLDDANGRAVWALGFLISKKSVLPANLISTAKKVFLKALPHMKEVHSTRSMAFALKGLYHYNSVLQSDQVRSLAETLANRLVQMYRHESSENWEWFESYLTYANSVLPESMLCAWLITGDYVYKNIARQSFGFLLSSIFNKNGIEVISNKRWLYKGQEAGRFGEQPIDVAYTILALSRFYDKFNDEEYLRRMVIAFNWFLGNNRLNHIVYNPKTGGCYDGLEEDHVNVNQGAESTISYLLARLTMEKYRNKP